MSKIIAGLYEIEQQIGAGGGGVVYIGEHLRLNKKIVLKEDKRRLSTQTEALRREVDLLKGLSQTYIPQVYDFVQEDGSVYTVMDYIDGESLDKLLAKNQIPTQAQMIQWACQLLEALSYLHTRPPHGILHGDIKPANIMLRSNGDMCLIDFNIALALGEDGAVKVGFSRGYASPEHYGADYIAAQKAAGMSSTTKSSKSNVTADRTKIDDDRTEIDDDKTEVDEIQSDILQKKIKRQTDVSTGSTTGGKNSVKLDVRSDIYSLGATLYHLISGKKPAQKAQDVIPLGSDVCSPAVSIILQKAMAQSPADRYQTAEEMLEAFLQLHKTDERAVRHKRRMAASAAILSAMFLAGGACTFVGLKQMEHRQRALTLAEYSATALAQGEVTKAVNLAMQAIPTKKSILNAPVTAEAQKALTGALGVYDLADGFKDVDSIELTAQPFDITVSPQGSRFAVVYAYEAAVYEMETLEKIAALPTQQSALADAVFVDESRIIYAGEEGITAYDIDAGKKLWTGKIGTMIALSSDKNVVAAVNRSEEYAMVYQVSDGTVVKKCSFGGLHMDVPTNDIFADAKNNLFALNGDGTYLAVSFSSGAMNIYNLKDEDEDLLLYDESEFDRFQGGFYGKYFAYAAQNSKNARFGIIDTSKAEFVGGYNAINEMQLRTDDTGIYLANGNLLVKVDPIKMEEMELAYTNGTNITGFAAAGDYCIVATDDNAFAFYDSGANQASKVSCNVNCDFVILTDKNAVIANRDEPSIRVMQLEEHSDAQLFSYDARYAHDEARISRDQKTIMLFDYQHFRIYDVSGEIRSEVELPEPESIYDQQFRREDGGSWLEVIWYDGTVRCYSASDGTVISEEKKAAPSKDLYEEFFTKDYRIASSLHSAPKVYRLGTDTLVAALEEEAYLTYVTQMGEYIITEYIRADGTRYGILLDDRLQQLAYLPNLCDAYDNRLVFDYPSGDLRQCHLYSLEELLAIGETMKK